MNGNEVVGVFADVDIDIDTKDVVIDADVLNAEAATLVKPQFKAEKSTYNVLFF